MLYVILDGDFAITANDVSEIEQIQRELQRRGVGAMGAFNLLTDSIVQKTARGVWT